MGLLDDAIRQHLELKRQHGADPGEVAEKERQAFGPIKRGDLEVGVEADDDVSLPDVDAPLPEAGAELPPAEPWADDPLVGAAEPTGSVAFDPTAETPAVPPEDPAEEQPFVAPPDVPFAPSAEPDVYAPDPAEHAHAFDPAPAPPVAAPADEPPAAAEPFREIGEPTQEYSVIDDAPDPQPDAAPGEHDELEETPDFLEETPEHDRLWFEQKPPRDFDF